MNRERPAGTVGRRIRVRQQIQRCDGFGRGRRGERAAEQASSAARHLRVLVADDYVDAADSLAMLLRQCGYDVCVAYDGAAALQLALSRVPDVMLLDIEMPQLSGYLLAQQLRQQARFKDVLLIAITGYADAAHRLLWQDAFDLYLVKPVEPRSLEGFLKGYERRLAEVPQGLTDACPRDRVASVAALCETASVRVAPM